MSEKFEIMNRELKITDEEFKQLRAKNEVQILLYAGYIKNVMIAALVVLFISIVAVNIALLPYELNFMWLAIELVIMVVFTYDPKIENDKKYRYETDKRVLLDADKKMLKLNKARLGFVICVSVFFALTQIVCWVFVYSIMSADVSFPV